MRCHQRGMSYVEILMAMAVFVLTAGAILGSYLAMQQLSENATNSMVALSHVDDLMERITSTPFQNVQDTFPDGAADGGGVTDYAGLVGGYTLDGEQITVTYPAATQDMLEIVVTVSWTQRSRARTARLSTVRSRG